jgi:hypothetical protein
VLRRNRLPLLVLPGALLLVGSAAWKLGTPRLTSTEAAIQGLWSSAPQTDGLSTTMLLRPDRTCQVRWLNRAGGDGRAPHECRRWWVEGGTLFVEQSRAPGWFELQARSTTAPKVWLWRFAIQEDTLLFARQNNAPMTLRRSYEKYD